MIKASWPTSSTTNSRNHSVKAKVYCGSDRSDSYLSTHQAVEYQEIPQVHIARERFLTFDTIRRVSGFISASDIANMYPLVSFPFKTIHLDRNIQLMASKKKISNPTLRLLG
jgi:hypothetical protein